MTSDDLRLYLADNADIPNAAALGKEGYLDGFGFAYLWDPLTESLFVALDDGFFEVVSQETVRTTNWQLRPFGPEQAHALLERYQAHFSRLERFFQS